jgi:hypothetical protein
MRKLLVLGSVMLMAIAGTASAATLEWHGTMGLDLGNLAKVRITGTGVATVNNTTGNSHLNSMFLAGGIAGPGAPVVVTDPDTSGLIPSVRVTATLKTGFLSGLSGGPPGGGSIPVKGLARVCLLSIGCQPLLYIPLALTKNNGATGVGVGGLLTTLGVNNLRFSVQANPWTIGASSGVNQTANGAFKTLQRSGFAHGPASNSSTTLRNSGVIQLITPAQVDILGVPANNLKLTLFSTLTIHFVPEPGLLLLIGSGVVGLGLLGRSRLRK